MSSPTTPTRKRDWKKYNNALVSRAELFLDLKTLKNWERDLRKMNRNKNGRKFIYPESFFRYLALLQTYYRLSCRAAESLLGFLERHIPILKKPDHSTIHRRITKLEFGLGESVKHRKNLVVSIDSSGLKVHNRGEWIRHKHKIRRGYLKIHFAVNPKTREIIELRSTKEEVHDNKMFRPLVRSIVRRYAVKKVLADAAHDDHRNFNILDQLDIIPAIKMKGNSNAWKWHPKFDWKHRVRRGYVTMMIKSFKDWRRRLGYKKRWVSEIVFSSFKANFGEYFASKKMENIKKEIIRKAYVHNLLMNHLAKC
jgi:hypothetical protein